MAFYTLVYSRFQNIDSNINLIEICVVSHRVMLQKLFPKLQRRKFIILNIFHCMIFFLNDFSQKRQKFHTRVLPAKETIFTIVFRLRILT